MRVIAGAAKGRRLVAPRGSDVRPTSDRVREALFASLQPVLSGAGVVDLFAGTGALGLEALSRGAARVTFVESQRVALESLRHNVEVVGLDGARVLAVPVARALGALEGERFDIALLDPPYDLGGDELAAVLEALVDCLAADATVVVERSVRSDTPAWPVALLPEEPRRYGDTMLHRARRRPEPVSEVRT